MKNILPGITAVFILLLSAVSGCSTGESEPLIVLIERNPWLMVIGSDSPSFALYKNGEIIFLEKTAPGSMKYMHVKLGRKELASTIRRLTREDDFLDLKDHYELSEATDQPTAVFIIRLGEMTKELSVYGNLRSNEEVRSRAPKPVIALFDAIAGYRHPDAAPWMPRKVEVMVWPYEYAPGASILWPEGWPEINDPSTRKRGEDSYSIFLDSSLYENLTAFLCTQKEKGAVEINGRKWVTSIRFPFPGEKAWMR